MNHRNFIAGATLCLLSGVASWAICRFSCNEWEKNVTNPKPKSNAISEQIGHTNIKQEVIIPGAEDIDVSSDTSVDEDGRLLKAAIISAGASEKEAESIANDYISRRKKILRKGLPNPIGPPSSVTETTEIVPLNN